MPVCGWQKRSGETVGGGAAGLFTGMGNAVTGAGSFEGRGLASSAGLEYAVLLPLCVTVRLVLTHSVISPFGLSSPRRASV